jgi:hypothetical protein
MLIIAKSERKKIATPKFASKSVTLIFSLGDYWELNPDYWCHKPNKNIIDERRA